MKEKNVQVKAFLNPNPAIEAADLKDPHGQNYKMRNRPFVEVMLIGLARGDYEVTLNSKHLSGKRIVRVDAEDSSSSAYFFSESLEGLSQVRVTVIVEGDEFSLEKSLTLKTHMVRGRVVDRRGDPLNAYVWATRKRLVEHEIVAVTDNDGVFAVRCPRGRELNLFVGDREYAQSTMEAWVMKDDTDADLRLERITIGDFEVYGLKAWHSASAWHVFFLPAKAGEKMPPALDADDMKVYVDGVEKEIQSCTRHFVGGDYPSYILSVDAEKLHDRSQWIKVVVDAAERGYGEAHFFTND